MRRGVAGGGGGGGGGGVGAAAEATALKWFMQAADRGHALALYSVGSAVEAKQGLSAAKSWCDAVPLPRPPTPPSGVRCIALWDMYIWKGQRADRKSERWGGVGGL